MDDATPLRIFKYTLSISLKLPTTIEMPVDRKIIAVGVQDNQVVIWVQVNPDGAKVRVGFTIVWTGDLVPTGKYRGTVTIKGLVYHIYGGHRV